MFVLKLKPESTSQLYVLFEQSTARQWGTLLWLRLLRYTYTHMRENFLLLSTAVITASV